MLKFKNIKLRGRNLVVNRKRKTERKQQTRKEKRDELNWPKPGAKFNKNYNLLVQNAFKVGHQLNDFHHIHFLIRHFFCRHSVEYDRKKKMEKKRNCHLRPIRLVSSISAYCDVVSSSDGEVFIRKIYSAR